MKEPLNRYTAIGVAVLLLLALANMSSGYYEFLRWAVFLSGLYFAFGVIKKADWYSGLLVGLAVLFNPFSIITFSKDTWSLIDIGGAIVFFSLLGLKGESGYKIQSSRLSSQDYLGYGDEAAKIVGEYGKLIEELNSVHKHEYPALVWPISLLPASKADIEEAIDYIMAGAEEAGDEAGMNALSGTKFLLDRFIADEDAQRQSEELSAKRAAIKAKG